MFDAAFIPMYLVEASNKLVDYDCVTLYVLTQHTDQIIDTY